MAEAILQFILNLFWIGLVVTLVAAGFAYMDHRAQRKKEQSK